MSLMSRWKNYQRKPKVKLRVIEGPVIDVPPRLPEPEPEQIAASPTPEAPAAAIPQPVLSECAHEWRTFCSGQRCQNCGLQSPPPPAPRPADEQSARAATIRQIVNGAAAYDSFETQLLRWRLRR
jgi:hypothetical protein